MRLGDAARRLDGIGKARRLVASAWATAMLAVSTPEPASAQIPPPNPALMPAAIEASDVRLRLELVGRMPAHINPTSPAVAGKVLLLVDQAGTVYRWDGTSAVPLLTQKSAPFGLSLMPPEGVLNVAADRPGTTVYVVYLSANAPKGIPQHRSPRDPDSWYVVVAYAFDGLALTQPRALVAFQARREGHIGGGLVVDDDGTLLLAIGDNGDSFEDGREHGQVPEVHLAKIVRIDPADGRPRVVALGVRCIQRLAFVGAGEARMLVFADPGGWVSEEINAVPASALQAERPLNFGWGRHADGKAREGTFEIDRMGNATGKVPDADQRFVPPIAEFGRSRPEPIAVSGPGFGASLSRVSLLFGDLVTGRVFARLAPLDAGPQPVKEVRLVSSAGEPVTLRDLAGGTRPDPRFFTFPDGSAGILLEATGDFYRVTELP